MRAKKITLGFIGAGRVGTGLATGFAHAGVSVVAIASRKIASAQKLAKRVPGARACASQEVADRADIVFLTVPDDAIEAVAAGVKWRAGSACVHCSGAAELDALKKAVADGALAGGFHPLHMFGEAGEPAGALAGSAIALAGPDSLELYRILSLRTIPLALAKGTLKPEAAEEITALLRSRGVSPRGKSDT